MAKRHSTDEKTSHAMAVETLGKRVKQLQLRSSVRAGWKGAKTKDDDKILSIRGGFLAFGGLITPVFE